MTKNIAIISGASSGIGREFCRQLDTYGFDEIWGIALENEGLLSLNDEISTKLISFACDLTDMASFKAIETKLKNEKPNVMWLINCSGYGKYGRYDEIETTTQMNMIDLNCNALVHMTQSVLPYMQKGAKILQIASVAGFQPIPYLSVYGATKAFVVSYSRSLNVELKSRGISVTCVCPFWTKTNFFKRAAHPEKEVVTKYSVMYDPQKVVRAAIKHAKKGKELSVYGTKAKLQVRFVKLMPHKLIMKIWIKQQKLDKKYKSI